MDFEDAQDLFAKIDQCMQLLTEMGTELHASKARIATLEQDRTELQHQVLYATAKNVELEAKVDHMRTQVQSLGSAPRSAASPPHPPPAELTTLVAAQVETQVQAFTDSVQFELELTAINQAARELVVRLPETDMLPACPALAHDLGLPLHAIDQIRRGKEPQRGFVFWTITFASRAYRDDAFYKRDAHNRHLGLDLRASNTRRQRAQRRRLQAIEEVVSQYACEWIRDHTGILLKLNQGDPLLLKDADHAAHVMRQMNFALKQIPGSPRQRQAAPRRQQPDNETQPDNDDRRQRPRLQTPARETQVPAAPSPPGTQPPSMTQPPGMTQPMDHDLPPHMTEPRGPPPPGMELPIALRKPSRASTAGPPPPPPAPRASGSGSGPGSGAGPDRGRTPTPGRGRSGGCVRRGSQPARYGTFRPY